MIKRLYSGNYTTILHCCLTNRTKSTNIVAYYGAQYNNKAIMFNLVLLRASGDGGH